jgi:hypothetical protein
MPITIDVIDVDESEIDIKAINEQDLLAMNDWRLYNLIKLANNPINNIFAETSSVMITLRNLLYFESAIPVIIYQSKNTTSISLDFIKTAILGKDIIRVPAGQNINVQGVIISKKQTISKEVLSIMGIATYTPMARYLMKTLFKNFEYIFMEDKFKEYSLIKTAFTDIVKLHLHYRAPFISVDPSEYKFIAYKYNEVEKIYIEFNKLILRPTNLLHSGIFQADIIQSGAGYAFLDYMFNGDSGKIFNNYMITVKDNNAIEIHNRKIFNTRNMKTIVLLRYLDIIKAKMSTAVYNMVAKAKSPEDVIKALSKTEQNILHSSYKLITEQWKLVRTNKCEHIAALKSQEYEKIIPFINDLTQVNEVIICNNCSIPFICPHLLAYYKLPEKTGDMIFQALSEFISNDTSIKDKFNYYCKLCGGVIMSIVKDNDEQLSNTDNVEKNSIWGQVSRMLNLLTYKIIVSVKKIANDSTTILIKNIERYVEIFKLKSKSHDYEEMRKAVTVIFVTAYVFDIIIRSNGNIEYKGESGKSPNKLVQLLLSYTTATNYKTFTSLNISTDKVIVMFKDAYNLLKGLSFVESNDYTSDILTAILNDNFYKFSYKMALIEGAITEYDTDAAENFKIVYGMSFKDLLRQNRLIKQDKIDKSKIIIPRPFMPNIKNNSILARCYRNLVDYNNGNDHKAELVKLRATEKRVIVPIITAAINSPDTYYHYYYCDTRIMDEDIGRIYDINGVKHKWTGGKCSICNIAYKDRINYGRENHQKINTSLKYINSFKSVFAFFENNCPAIDNGGHVYNKGGVCNKCGLNQDNLYKILYEDKKLEDEYYTKYYSIYQVKIEESKRKQLLSANELEKITYSTKKSFIPEDEVITTDGELLGYTESLEYDYKVISEYFDKYQDLAANRVKGMIIDFISKYNAAASGKLIKFSDYVNNYATYTARELQVILFSISKKFKGHALLANIIKANMLYSKPKVFNLSLLYSYYDNSGREYEDIEVEDTEPEVTEDLPNLLPSGEN